MKLKLKNASWSLSLNSAVYILMLRGEIVYIGESKNPFSRIGCHVKDMHKRFDSLRIMPCADHRRKYWEAVLIDRYQPIFNSKGKDKETNERHIFELGQIKRRQAKQRIVCENCKRNRQLSITNGGNAFFVRLEEQQLLRLQVQCLYRTYLHQMKNMKNLQNKSQR
jgi:hypothetical protein